MDTYDIVERLVKWSGLNRFMEYKNQPRTNSTLIICTFRISTTDGWLVQHGGRTSCIGKWNNIGTTI